MKYLCLMLITFFLFPSSIITAQSDDLSPVNTLLDQAEIALDEGNLPTAQGLIIGANLLISKDMMTSCPVLESVKSLLDQASTMPDVERTRSVLISARVLIDTCATPEVIATPDVPQNPNAITAQNVAQVTQLAQFGNGHINKLVYSPTGDTFALMGTLGIWLYDATIPNATPVLLDGHSRILNDIAYSPDGRYLASCGDDEMIYIWDVANQRSVQSIFNECKQVLFSPDSRFLMFLDYGFINFWSLEQETNVYTQEMYREGASLENIAYSPLGNMIVVNFFVFDTLRSAVSLWTISDTNFGAGVEITMTHELETPSHFVRDMVFSPDGSRLVATTQEGEISIWDVPTASLFRVITEDTSVTGYIAGVEYNPTGENFLTYNYNRMVKIWSPNGDMQSSYTFDDWSNFIYHPNGQMLMAVDYSVTDDYRVQTIEASTGNIIQTRLDGQFQIVDGALVSPDGQFVAVNHRNKMVIHSTQTGDELITLYGHSYYERVYSPDGRFITQVDSDGVAVLDATSGQLMWLVPQPAARSIAYSPDGRSLAIGDNNGMVHVWDVEARVKKMSFVANSISIRVLKYSPDGRMIALSVYSSDDNTIHLWDAQTGVALGILEGHTLDVFNFIYDPTSHYLASASGDYTVRVWDMTTNTQLMMLELGAGHTPYRLSYSPDGRLLAVGYFEGNITIFDAQTGLVLHQLAGHRNGVSMVQFIADGTRLISASSDGTVRVWGIPSS